MDKNYTKRGNKVFLAIVISAVLLSSIFFLLKDNLNQQNISKDFKNIKGFLSEQFRFTGLAIFDFGNAYSIIGISKAEHLNSDKQFISDIYNQVKELDDVWSEEIRNNEYVRITFEKNLTKDNDITLYPRIINGTPKIEIHEKDKTGLVAEFSYLDSNEYNKISLANLPGSQDVFDLQILNGSLEFDYIVDPAITPGTAFCWGFNNNGQLGIGSIVNMNTTQLVIGGLNITSISSGGSHTCGITNNGNAYGSAYCWGYNGNGEVGIGNASTPLLQPTLVVGGLNFTNISSGNAHTCGITTNGSVYCWGLGSSGELGQGSSSNSNSPVLTNQFGQGGVLNFTAISTGYGETCGIAINGSAYCWGSNAYGQLGIGKTSSQMYSSANPIAVVGGLNFTTISVGVYSVCGITISGSAYCWGYNVYGQLGIGNTSDSISPQLIVGGLNFRGISTGNYFTCGVAINGSAYCWGYNSNGQLGIGNISNTLQPQLVAGGLNFTAISVDTYSACGIIINKSAYCWGSNLNGQLGNGTSGGQSTTPVLVLGGLNFTSISTGSGHTCGMGLDFTSPGISILYPSNNTNYSNLNININYTIGDNIGIGSCWYSNDTYSVNLSLGSNCVNITNITWSEGQHNVTVWINDSSNNINSSFVTFNLDSLPNIQILFPQNNTNTSNSQINVNYTFYDTRGIGSCWYSNSSGKVNYTLANCANITGVTWIQGINNITIWVNDTVGNQNNSKVTFTIDSIPPTINITYPPNNTITGNTQININYTVSDNVGLSKCWYSNDSGAHNNTLTNCANITGVTGIQGINNITIWVNDSSNNFNQSYITFTINSNYSLHMNITSPITANPLSVSNYSNISINFNFIDNENANITSGITLNNITIGGQLVSPITIVNGRNNTRRSCSQVWGVSSCGGEASTCNYATDGCCAGSYFVNGFTVDEVYVNATTAAIGDTINITCSYYCFGGLDNLGISYYNGTWNQIWFQTGGCSAGRSNYSKTVIVSGNTGTQKVRCQIGMNAVSGTCFSGTFSDDDEVNFTVIAPSALLYIPNIGWQANVTVPAGLTGFQDLFVNATYSGVIKNDTQKRAISYPGGDLEYPQFSNYWDNNGTQIKVGTAYLNITATSTNGTVILTFNNQNYTASNSSGNAAVFNVTITSLTNRTYYYNWSSYGNGTSNLYNISNSQAYIILDDITPPDIQILFPQNNTNSSKINLNINYTARDNVGIGSCWYSNDSYSINVSLPDCSTNLTNFNWTEGKHNITIYANDTSNNINSSSVYFTIDAIPPNIQILFPQNNTNTTNTQLNVNYTISDNLKVGSCWYSNDTYLFNTTLSDCENITAIVWSEGAHNVVVWANDSTGNENHSGISFRIEAITPPVSIQNNDRGSVSTIKSSDFSLDKDLIDLKIKQGETRRETILVNNTGDKRREFTLSLSGVNKFAILSEQSFTLSPKESKEINIDFFASEKEPGEIYSGRIVFSTDSDASTKSVNIIFEIKERSALFDVKSELRDITLTKNQKLRAKINMTDVGDLNKEVDVTLQYSIKDFDNNEIKLGEETIGVNKYSEIERDFTIPSLLAEGNYLFYVKLSYSNATATSSNRFSLVKESKLEGFVNKNVESINKGLEVIGKKLGSISKNLLESINKNPAYVIASALVLLFFVDLLLKCREKKMLKKTRRKVRRRHQKESKKLNK